MPNTTLKGQYAGFASRFVAFAIDLALVLVSAGAINWVIIATLGLVGIDLTSPLADGANRFTTIVFVGALLLLVSMPFLLLIMYLLLFWTTTGQTIGKRIAGVRVVRIDGERMRTNNAVRRIIMYFVSMLPLFLGFIWVLFDDQRRGWHDKAAGTCVIYAWDAREMAEFMRATHRRAERIENHLMSPPVLSESAPDSNIDSDRVSDPVPAGTDSAESSPISGAQAR